MKLLAFLACVVAVVSLGAAATLGLSALLAEPDPFAQLGEPVEFWGHDQVVFGDGQVLAVEEVFAGVDSLDWESFARDVVKSGGRFERVSCERWRDGREEMNRCVPVPIRWTDVIAHDFVMEA